jgi:hypothetical protein
LTTMISWVLNTKSTNGYARQTMTGDWRKW